MMKMEFTAIGSSLILSLAITFMCGVAEIAPGLNCRSSDKILNRKVGKRSHSVSFPLIHIYSECSPFRPPNRTWESLMSEKIRGDANRLRFLKRTSRSSKEDANANVPVRSGSGEYIIQVDFGTPKQSMYTLIDTGSDVAWIPCKQCQGCHSTAPIFDPAKSSSYKPFACDSQPCQEISGNCGGNSKCQFEVLYGDGTQVDGTLASDAITLGSQYLPNFSFGCAESLSEDTYSSPGLMGLGGGSLSLLTQAPTAELFGGTFSYCLPSSSTSSGSLVLGKEAAVSSSSLKFTTLIKDPSFPTFYFVTLKAISVGNTRISVPATNIASGGGTIIDSGTTITYLVPSAYKDLRDAFRQQLSSLQPTPVEDMDTCYDLSSSSVDVPTITLHLDRNVDLVLPKENILITQESGLSCLAFSSTDSRSIIGNVQQQNWRIVFDVPNSQVGFAQEQCAAPA
uniref:Peptidase A1 domain-containing protein n=1 Tax=Picea sitchensis TaxID=3332 RepID=C0PSK0_PICSI|nr:unknown [Picea sitchensis]